MAKTVKAVGRELNKGLLNRLTYTNPLTWGVNQV